MFDYSDKDIGGDDFYHPCAEDMLLMEKRFNLSNAFSSVGQYSWAKAVQASPVEDIEMWEMALSTCNFLRSKTKAYGNENEKE